MFVKLELGFWTSEAELEFVLGATLEIGESDEEVPALEVCEELLSGLQPTNKIATALKTNNFFV